MKPTNQQNLLCSCTPPDCKGGWVSVSCCTPHHPSSSIAHTTDATLIHYYTTHDTKLQISLQKHGSTMTSGSRPQGPTRQAMGLILLKNGTCPSSSKHCTAGPEKPSGTVPPGAWSAHMLLGFSGKRRRSPRASSPWSPARTSTRREGSPYPPRSI